MHGVHESAFASQRVPNDHHILRVAAERGQFQLRAFLCCQFNVTQLHFSRDLLLLVLLPCRSLSVVETPADVADCHCFL